MHKTHTSEQKRKRQHFSAHKKDLRGGSRLFACMRFVLFVLFVLFMLCMLFVCVKFSRKKIKRFEISFMASFTLLLIQVYLTLNFLHNTLQFLRSE